MGHAFQETLRLYPAVGIGHFRVNFLQDLTLAGQLRIPKGGAIWLASHALHNASFNWDDPDAFLPGRVLQGLRGHDCIVAC